MSGVDVNGVLMLVRLILIENVFVNVVDVDG